jgi:hypothetical protein
MGADCKAVQIAATIFSVSSQFTIQSTNLFHFPRRSLNAADCQPLRVEAMVAWKELLASAPQYNLSVAFPLRGSGGWRAATSEPARASENRGWRSQRPEDRQLALVGAEVTLEILLRDEAACDQRNTD